MARAPLPLEAPGHGSVDPAFQTAHSIRAQSHRPLHGQCLRELVIDDESYAVGSRGRSLLPPPTRPTPTPTASPVGWRRSAGDPPRALPPGGPCSGRRLRRACSGTRPSGRPGPPRPASAPSTAAGLKGTAVTSMDRASSSCSSLRRAPDRVCSGQAPRERPSVTTRTRGDRHSHPTLVLPHLNWADIIAEQLYPDIFAEHRHSLGRALDPLRSDH